MARPGGNPGLVEHQFTTDRPEPLLAKLQLRITKSMKAEVEAIPNWQEFVREAISEKLLERNS
ncbi:hypothetical protein [Acaryochloris marina]|uniref:Uncharacterized protein n=1 Tax=Acaryochloris marina (strain MBIC 11017) TaxID=329726 RepID=B0C0L7_ACAM1|nr:hypothetical protein [Acaryochloris marina]ABW30810.1 conserved hypothetical protein [Acaryochloris marina MBIC11017]BDM79561.1 hypothetical protein AM10699_24290 [Acaryochloris marina MBIC10699]